MAHVRGSPAFSLVIKDVGVCGIHGWLMYCFLYGHKGCWRAWHMRVAHVLLSFTVLVTEKQNGSVLPGQLLFVHSFLPSLPRGLAEFSICASWNDLWGLQTQEGLGGPGDPGATAEMCRAALPSAGAPTGTVHTRPSVRRHSGSASRQHLAQPFHACAVCLTRGWDTSGVCGCPFVRVPPLARSLGQATCTQDLWLLVPQGNERTRG